MVNCSFYQSHNVCFADVSSTDMQMVVRCFGDVLAENHPAERTNALNAFWKNMENAGEW